MLFLKIMSGWVALSNVILANLSESSEEENSEEKMVTIKCQRLKADKTYEEVEIQVLAAVYHTMMIHSDPQTGHPPQKQQLALHEKKGLTLGLTNKIKCLFSKTEI